MDEFLKFCEKREDESWWAYCQRLIWARDHIDICLKKAWVEQVAEELSEYANKVKKETV